ncbi:MAG: hypothetical protein QNJ44_13900 [Rhodobacter sp.]|nr:hypothetical protein [Rhodobacter sp.]
MLEINLIGSFEIRDDQGVDRRPKLMKSKAIVAVLATIPGHRHSRSWFQGLFWADRQHEQALSSLRSALADIRRQLGPHSAALISDNTDVALDPNLIRVDIHSDRNAADLLSGGFLEGFDIAHAEAFEDWLRQARMEYECKSLPRLSPASPCPPQTDAETGDVTRLYLASGNDVASTVTQIQCETLVDGLAKSVDDLGFAEIVDGRGRGRSMDDFIVAATGAECSLLLVADAAEAPSGAIARLKMIETPSGRLVWSKSVVGSATLDLEDPATIGVVAEFVDVLSERLFRTYQERTDRLSPQLLGAAGINHAFKLGSQNYEAAEDLLKRAHEWDPRGSYLAWRAYLRTLLIGELNYSDREAVIEEGTYLAERALEIAPNNSMVLAVCAHVQNMLHDDYERAFDLSTRALELNRCNPIAWIGLGASAIFLGKEQAGYKIAKVGSRLSIGSRFSFFADSWASAAGVLAGSLKTAEQYAERSHAAAPTYAPPLRYLTALYCASGQFERAEAMAEKLRQREPDFTLERLRDHGYPSDSLRRARLLETLPYREI